jgi:hypothetical protein
MPEDHWLSFECEGFDPSSLPMMRAALNAMVDATIDNTTASDDERIFMHGTDHTFIEGVDFPSDFTIMPREIHIVVGDSVEGKGFGQGNLRYTISDFENQNCKMCSYFAASGAAASATAAGSAAQQAVVQTATKLVSPGLGLLGALITLGCLAGC